MAKRNVLFSVVGSAITCLVLTSIGQATVPRAFVSINGSDNNPCSAVQPCRSFNQALTVVQAGGGIVGQNPRGDSTGFTVTPRVTIYTRRCYAFVITPHNTQRSTTGAGAAAGWLSNCTASPSSDGFVVGSFSSGNADLMLTNCRAFGNTEGLFVTTTKTGDATMRIDNCVVTQNAIGIRTVGSGFGFP